MNWWTVAAAAGALAWSGAASARTVGGWDIEELDESCVMTMEYGGKGETALWFFYNPDGSQILTVSNSNWTPKAGETYQMSFQVDDTVWGPGVAVALKGQAKPMLGVSFPETSEFEPAFRAGRDLRIFLDDTMIDHLDLQGTGAAGAVTRQCAARVGARLAAEAREKARYDFLPDDPFKTQPSKEARERGGKSATLLDAGFSEADLPPDGSSVGETKVVLTRVTVGTNGRATACAVEVSSGSESLDVATCRLVSARSRFAVGTDEMGSPVEQTISVPIDWRSLSAASAVESTVRPRGGALIPRGEPLRRRERGRR